MKGSELKLGVEGQKETGTKGGQRSDITSRFDVNKIMQVGWFGCMKIVMEIILSCMCCLIFSQSVNYFRCLLKETNKKLSF